MSTVFESISDGFYTAFFEPDPEKRKETIDAWIKDSTPIIQSAVEDELRAYLKELLEGTWIEKGWEARAKKFYGQYSGMVRKKGDEAIPFVATIVADFLPQKTCTNPQPDFVFHTHFSGSSEQHRI